MFFFSWIQPHDLACLWREIARHVRQPRIQRDFLKFKRVYSGKFEFIKQMLYFDLQSIHHWKADTIFVLVLLFVGAWKCAHIMTYIACEDQRLCDLFSFIVAHGVAGKTWSCISSRSSFISPWIALIFWTCWMLYIMKTLPGFQYDWCCLILVIVCGKSHNERSCFDLIVILLNRRIETSWSKIKSGSRFLW